MLTLGGGVKLYPFLQSLLALVDPTLRHWFLPAHYVETEHSVLGCGFCWLAGGAKRGPSKFSIVEPKSLMDCALGVQIQTGM